MRGGAEAGEGIPEPGLVQDEIRLRFGCRAVEVEQGQLHGADSFAWVGAAAVRAGRAGPAPCCAVVAGPFAGLAGLCGLAGGAVTPARPRRRDQASGV
ncbi:hypothetical protein GCM10025734_01720 [Kitasatospora paranensis]